MILTDLCFTTVNITFSNDQGEKLEAGRDSGPFDGVLSIDMRCQAFGIVTSPIAFHARSPLGPGIRICIWWGGARRWS